MSSAESNEDIDRTRHRADAGDAVAMNTLANLLSDQGDIEP
jgi:hypothetical protein